MEEAASERRSPRRGQRRAAEVVGAAAIHRARARAQQAGTRVRGSSARGFFYFYIFYFCFLQKYIFDFKIYRNILRPPGSRAVGTWPPGSGAAGAFVQKLLLK